MTSLPGRRSRAAGLPRASRHARVVPTALLSLGLLSLGSLVGCSVPFDERATNLVNACSSDADCPAGVCLPTDAGALCAATEVDLGAVLLEIRSPSGLAGATSTFVSEDAAKLVGSYPSGALLELELDVPPLVQLSGSWRLPGGKLEGCTADDGSVPVRIEVRATSAYVGLEGSVYSSTSQLAEGSERFGLEVPIGRYDVHLTPIARSDACGPLLPPPRLLLDVDVPKAVGRVELEPPVEPPASVGGTLLVPTGGSVSGWSLDVVDPKYGLPLSRPLVFGSAEPVSGAVAIAEPGLAELPYSFAQSAVLRLRDADGALAVHWSLSALDLDGDGVVELDLRDLIANPKSLVATVLDADARPVSAATVTVQSLSLTGGVNQNASFRVLAESDLEGQVSVQLVPGSYAVSIVPPSGGPASLVTDWVITESTQCCGKTFELPRRALVGGDVVGLDGAGLPDVTVFASPSLQEPASYFASSLQPLQLLPRPSSTSTDASGAFELLVDPGTLDLSVRADASSGYPWLVVPRLLVQGPATLPRVNLGRLGVLAPAIVQGQVRSAGREVPRATVRAWLPVPSSGGSAKSVPLLQIGEASADASGRFVLPLPPRITLSAPAEPPPPR